MFLEDTMKKLLSKIDLYHYISDLNRLRKCSKKVKHRSLIAYDIRAKLGYSNSPVDVTLKVPLALIAIFKNETEYLEEWLEYYLLLGVEHFYLYDNNENDSALSVLRPYIDQGIVTHIPWPTIEDERLLTGLDNSELFSTQHLAYGDFILRFRDHCQWVLKVDIDEFAYPLSSSPYSSLVEYLNSLDSQRVKAVVIPEIRFGANGHMIKPKGSVVESYYKGGWGESIKSIANTSFLKMLPYSDCHDFEYVLKYGTSVIKKKNVDNPLVYNHYYTKSKEEFLRRGAFNKKNWMNGKKNAESFEEEQLLCDKDEHTEILRFLPQLNKRLKDR